LGEDGIAERVQDLAHLHPRYGYRRVWVLLRRENRLVNVKRVHRLFKFLGLQVKRKPRKRIRTGETVPMKAIQPNHVWTYDFVLDAALNGDEIRCLTVVEEFTREALAIEVAGRIGSQKVKATLARLFQAHGRPSFIRSDNGSEFIAQNLKDWLAGNGNQTFYMPPGSPWKNGLCESFNGKFRDECLNLEAFSSLREAKVVIEIWRRDLQRDPAALQPRAIDTQGIQSRGALGDDGGFAPNPPGFIAFGTPGRRENGQGVPPGRHRSVPLGGARVASQRCPILRRDDNYATINPKPWKSFDLLGCSQLTDPNIPGGTNFGGRPQQGGHPGTGGFHPIRQRIDAGTTIADVILCSLSLSNR
jgi:putative transposase